MISIYNKLIPLELNEICKIQIYFNLIGVILKKNIIIYS